MARIRSIKIDFWLDEKVGSLPAQARLLFIGTWSLADDNGVLRGNPAYLRSQLFAYDEAVTAADVRRWVSALAAGSMLVPFTYKGESYFLVRRFRDHQKIDARYATELIPFAEVEAAIAEQERANTLTDNVPCEPHVNHACMRREEHVKHVLGVGVGVGVMEGVDTHTPVYTVKGGVGESAAAASDGSSASDGSLNTCDSSASGDAVPAYDAPADGIPADGAEDDDEDWYGVVEVSPAQAAEGDALNASGDVSMFVRRAEEIRRLIGERYPRIASMQEPLRDDQLLWIARRYAMEDVRRILSDMDDKRVYDPHSRSYRTKTFNAFMAFADCDRMVGSSARQGTQSSKRLYTYEEMCDEIPSRARQEDFTMVEVGGRKLWLKRMVV